jgi:hypothetical protein
VGDQAAAVISDINSSLRVSSSSRIATRSSLRGARLREDLVLFFLHVMVDVFAQHLHLGIEHLIGLHHSADLRDQFLGGLVLDVGFRDHVLVLDGFAHGRIEDFLLDLRVHRQLHADLLSQFHLLLGNAPGLGAGEFLVFLEHLLHGPVVRVEQVAGVFFRTGGRHVGSPWVWVDAS